jgi:hypothetical protein
MEPTMTEPTNPDPAGDPHPLPYATPAPKPPDPIIAFIRRLIFATGCGLLLGGLAYGLFPNTGVRDESATMVGIGSGLIALFPHLPRRRR